MTIKVLQGDCLEVMKTLPPASIDLVLCDLPYGTTQNKWDSVIPLDALWAQYWRLLRQAGAVVLTAQSPFDKVLGCSQLEKFRYEWIWEKTAATGFLNAKKAPLKAHENVLVFYREMPIYNPQKTQGHVIKRVNASYASRGDNYNKDVAIRQPYESTERYPRDVLLFPKDNRLIGLHPTQKPVALMEYLIRTYSNPGDLILDNCAGSGTTGIAAARADRRAILIEREPKYIDIITRRIDSELGIFA